MDEGVSGMESWSTFYKKTEDRGPSWLLSRAMKMAAALSGKRQAIDLGCGTGNETRQLVEAGWHVLAVDREPEALIRTTARCEGASHGDVMPLLAAFEQLHALPQSSLVYAGLSLPFCNPLHFEDFWQLVLRSLSPGGVFAGHFFGVRHGWSSVDHMTFHAERDIRELCEGMNIALLSESEQPRVGRAGQINWHRFDVLFSKPLPVSG